MCGADGYESVEGLSYEDVHSVLRKRLEKERQRATKVDQSQAAKNHVSGSEAERQRGARDPRNRRSE